MAKVESVGRTDSFIVSNMSVSVSRLNIAHKAVLNLTISRFRHALNIVPSLSKTTDPGHIPVFEILQGDEVLYKASQSVLAPCGRSSASIQM